MEKLPEQSLIYHPTKGRPVPPPPDLQDLYLTTDDGVRLNALYQPAPAGGPTLLYFHGNGGCLTYAGDIFSQARRVGMGCLAVDYRGYGLSEGHPSEEGLYRDARAAYAEARRRGIPPAKLLLHGQSLGGAVATRLAAEKPCAGLILESTFTSARAMGLRLYGSVAANLMVSRFPTQQTLPGLKCPVLIIHGDQDELAPVSMGKALYASGPKRKWLWTVPGAGHNNLRRTAGPAYALRLGEFWAQVRQK